MDLWRSLGGQLRVEMTCADPASALMQIVEAGITADSIVREDDAICFSFSISRKDRAAMEALAKKRGYDLRILGRSGLYWPIRGLLRRPVLVAGVMMLLLLSLYLPSRVLFVRVEGNETIPTNLILEKCQESGISFGASRRQVRSEQVKNALLDAIPQLQWAGVNTYGCTAVISVKERSDEERSPEADSSVSSIVALRDGLITRCVVTRGNQLCRVGQVVRSGEVLVSGYTDCGISIQAGPSQGEIYAQTNRNLEAVMPSEWIKQTKGGTQEKKYALIIGKKRINFYKGSGISGSSCDKMYEEYYVTLPGGFVLPIGIITEVWSGCTESTTQITQEEAQSVLEQFSRRYVRSQMQAGEILGVRETVTVEPDRIWLSGNYACEEMIAQVKSEEIIKPDGKYNGADR